MGSPQAFMTATAKCNTFFGFLLFLSGKQGMS